MDTRVLDWEVNGKEQLGIAWRVIFHNEEEKYNARGTTRTVGKVGALLLISLRAVAGRRLYTPTPTSPVQVSSKYTYD